MTNKWLVLGLKSHTANGGIFYADLQYRIENIDLMIFAQKNISVEFTYDKTDENFIPFNEISEENVVNWAKEIIDYESIENEVLTDYNEQLSEAEQTNAVSDEFPENFRPLPPPFDTSGI